MANLAVMSFGQRYSLLKPGESRVLTYKSALSVRKEVTDEEFNTLRTLITPYNIVRIKARVGIDPLSGSHQTLLEAFIGSDESDTELNDRAEQLQEPITYDDPVLGKFTLDRRLDWVSANSVWKDNPVSLHLSATEPAEVQEALETAHSLWRNQNVWHQRIRNYAVQALLPLKNGRWIDDEGEVNADQFKDRMTLEAITVDSDGSFEFWHNDGDLFWGHSIQVSGNLSDGPTDADIPG